MLFGAFCPVLQTIQIASQSLLTLHGVNSTSLFTIISKPAKDPFNSSTQIIDKNVKEDWSQD